MYSCLIQNTLSFLNVLSDPQFSHSSHSFVGYHIVCARERDTGRSNVKEYENVCGSNGLPILKSRRIIELLTNYQVHLNSHNFISYCQISYILIIFYYHAWKSVKWINSIRFFPVNFKDGHSSVIISTIFNQKFLWLIWVINLEKSTNSPNMM